MEQVGRKICCAVAFVSALVGNSQVRAGDSILPIDHCQVIDAGDRSSYVLVKDIQTSGGTCLTVTANHVTIDMRGFSIKGNGSGVGIVAAVPVEGVTIRNGTVKGFETGISLAGPGSIVQNMHVDNNLDTGMVLGTSSLVSNVVAQGNRRSGIVVTTASTVKDSVLRFNGNNPASVGLSAGPGSTVTGNTIWGSIGTGLFASAGSTVIGNTVLETNPGIGMSILCPSNVKNNTATTSTQANLIVAGDGCNVFDNVTP
jgi:hypothetical protein